MTNKQRILMAIKGEMPDVIPFAPRLDLWYLANKTAGTLPEKYRNHTADDIARAEGWALHKINPPYQEIRKPEDNLHWALGILSYKEMVFGYRFSPDIDIEVHRDDGRTRIVYHTPVGSASTQVAYTEEMRRSGVSSFIIEEYALKGPADYAVLGYLFENLKLESDYTDFVKWQKAIGEDGLAFTMAGRAASPMHHIQKYFIDATGFYYHYKDNAKQITALAESLAPFFDQSIDMIAQSPAQAVYWGANFDDMITYPSYFQKEIMPWIGKAAARLGPKGIFVSCHCDGENKGLMDLIKDSGMHVAEAVCPYPMTKVPIEEYYARWSDKLTIFGGIPSTLLLEETTTEEEFEAYLDHLFKAVAPGRRIIFGIADSTPPKAVFSRLVRLGERVATEARLPLEGGAFRPLSTGDLKVAPQAEAAGFAFNKEFEQIQKDIMAGDSTGIKEHINSALKNGAKASEILHKGMLRAMGAIGTQFKNGELFIPEVLLSARTMNEATAVLEPYLAAGEAESGGRILIGTVFGDLHDIGKNLVAAMLRGVGFQVIDVGINVPAQEFVRQVEEHQPDIVGLSALLTTTMPEMKTVITALEEAGWRNKVAVMVGGAPVNQKFAKDIGADGYAADAGEAIVIAQQLLKNKKQAKEAGVSN